VFAVDKLVFNAGHVLVTTVTRVHVKMIFTCFCFNLLQLNTLVGFDSGSHRSAVREPRRRSKSETVLGQTPLWTRWFNTSTAPF